MESPSPSSLSALRHRLRATVCCCFGQQGAGGGGLSERMRWRRRAGVGEFRYDPLSYALNFDEGDLDVNSDDEEDEDEDLGARARRGDGLLYHSFSSRLSTPAAVVEVA
ncbi:uncharacterized protein LOC8077634 [Sorghum bicolor]|uniref:Uncharacterized protein n=1 Tax=Sorghum bicolor TaxID=4558 RepID=C5XWX0_SORBI|nr:uncharacterized protein LOC8077634 [Sorghum bicolor]EES06390.1 hypothetical protein SORBI_3004G067200 [Sorghum bicolor]|eukprot:XP_002453414.1 uncharacterized protein LOC8077634 [Sorghum bicolor]